MIKENQYIDRFAITCFQFGLAEKVFDDFQSKEKNLHRMGQQELKRFTDIVSKFAKESELETFKNWALSKEAKETFKSVYEEVFSHDLKNRLYQNRLILQVALIESALKDIHREVLRQKPTLLREDRQIPLGKLVALGPDRIIEDEIEREVQSLDRKTVKEKYIYFDEKLNLDWFEGSIVSLFETIVDTRNKILHEDPDLKVDNTHIALANLVGMSLPEWCILQAIILYPGGFQAENMRNLDKIREFVEDRNKKRWKTR
ncbi:MAG: hypothetical protein L0196_09125 [candidate division Zixibacteria bacterium]|nr:hypothetical protein [candidate division Zixibacteria bacterium]